MRRTAKHQAGVVSFNDFSGGINISSPGDLIAPNEMQVCQNFYFFANHRSLVPRGGLSKPLTTVGSDIVATFYDIDSNTYLTGYGLQVAISSSITTRQTLRRIRCWMGLFVTSFSSALPACACA